MKLRHLILLASAIGACGALLLAADMYRRLKEAEVTAALSGAAGRDDSVLTFGMAHTIGLLSLAFFFLALFLMLMQSVRDKRYVAAIENLPLPANAESPPASAPQAGVARISSISEAAALAPPAAPLEPVEVIPAPETIAGVAPVAAIPAADESRRVLAFEPPSESAPAHSTIPPDQQAPDNNQK